MAATNEELIRRGYEALNAGDLETIKGLIGPDCEIRTQFTSLGGRTYRGPEAIETWSAEASESWETMKQEPERFITVDAERTIVVVRFRGRGRESGVAIDQSLAVLVTIRDQKVVGIESHDSLDSALRVTGASE